jgi:hypothetical protein
MMTYAQAALFESEDQGMPRVRWGSTVLAA